MSERNLQRETAIYQAALGLIAQGASPAAMKVQDIAQAAGIGKGTVYEYFSSKEEILQGMALYCFDSEIAHIRARFAVCEILPHPGVNLAIRYIVERSCAFVIFVV